MLGMIKVNINTTTHCDSLGERVIYALSKIFIKFTSVTVIKNFEHNLNIMRQSACMVVNPIIVYSLVSSIIARPFVRPLKLKSVGW